MWASVLISAFIDNIPYVATMIPVIAGIAAEMGVDSTALYFGLLSGATLGGNCTPIGASAKHRCRICQALFLIYTPKTNQIKI